MSRSDQISQNDESYDEALLQNIRQQVCLNNHELLQLTYNDQKFYQTLKQLNHQGCQSIIKLKYHEALIYLNEAEKILEYAASCGRTIERKLIITTLNNQAALYQRAWQLQKAASYVEAIIYNLSSFFQKDEQYQFPQKLLNKGSSEYEDFRIYLWRKKILALYYLQFCALNSQNKKHQNAYTSASKAINLLKQICMDCYRYQNFIQQNNHEQTDKKNILKQLAKFKPLNKDKNSFELFFEKAINCIALYLRRTDQKQSQEQPKQIKKKFQNYSIGHLMQINPFELQKDYDKIDLQQQISEIQKIFKAVYVSIGHFILATQLRFISTQKYTIDENERRQSDEYKQSQNYHLYSIIIAARFLPCQSVYFEHIVNSFRNHYKIDLMQNAKQYLNDENINLGDENLLLIEETQIREEISKLEIIQVQKQVMEEDEENKNFDIKTEKSEEMREDSIKIDNQNQYQYQQNQNQVPSNGTKSTKKNKNKKIINFTPNKTKLHKSKMIQPKIQNENLQKTNDKLIITSRSSRSKDNKLKSIKNKSIHSKNKSIKQTGENHSNGNIKRSNGYKQNEMNKKYRKDSDYMMTTSKSRSKSKRVPTEEQEKFGLKRKDSQKSIKINKKVEEEYGIGTSKNTSRNNKHVFNQTKKSKSKKISLQKSAKFTSPQLKLKKLKSPRNPKKV